MNASPSVAISTVRNTTIGTVSRRPCASVGFPGCELTWTSTRCLGGTLAAFWLLTRYATNSWDTRLTMSVASLETSRNR